jgi:hypothetical protein
LWEIGMDKAFFVSLWEIKTGQGVS